MARKAYGLHATQVNTGTYADDPAYPIGSNEWNESFAKGAGIFGFDAQTVASASSITPNRSVVVISGSGATGTFALADSEQYDIIWVFCSNNATLTNRQTTPNTDGQIVGLDSGSASIALSTTVPKIFIRRTVGSVDAWFEYGGGVVADLGITTAKLAGDAVTGDKLADNAVDSEHYTDGSIDNAHIADDQIDSEHYAAGSIDLEHMSSESVDEDNLQISNAGNNGEFLSKQSGNTGGLTWAAVSGYSAPTIGSTSIGSGATVSTIAGLTLTSPVLNTGISGTALLDSDAMSGTSATTVSSSESIKAYVDAQVASNVTLKGDYNASTDSPSLDDGSPIAGILAGDHYVVSTAGTFFSEVLQAGDSIISKQDSPTTFAHWIVVNNNVVTPVVGANIANDAIDSQHYADGSIDNAHIADDAIDSEHYADGSIDNAHIADDAIDSEHYADGSIDLAHMSSQSVDEDNLYISNAGSNGEFLQKQSGNTGGLTWASAGGGATIVHTFTNTTTTGYLGTASSFGTVGAGDRDIFIKKIDSNNEGVFTKIWKNGSAVEVQLA